MSKIKVYLDTSALYQIFNDESDIIKLIKFECITSIQAIMELCISGGVEKNAEEIALFLSNFCKIRSIDYDVFTKFNSVYPSFNMGHAGSKTRSWGHLVRFKHSACCPLSNSSSFHLIFTNLGQKFYLDDLKAKFEHGPSRVKNFSKNT